MATAQQEIKALKQDMAQIKDILVDHVDGKSSNGSSKSKFFDVEDVKAKARYAGEQAREYLSAKQEQVIAARDVTEKTIKERPFMSTAIAFTGGALVAALLSRK